MSLTSDLTDPALETVERGVDWEERVGGGGAKEGGGEVGLS